MEPPETTIPYAIDKVRTIVPEPLNHPKRTRGYGAAVVARMTSKGQLTVPKAVREFMDLQAGDAVIISMLGEKVTIERCPRPGETEVPEVPEQIRRMTDDERQRLIDEGRRREWEAEVRREPPAWRREDEEPA
ncbi:MAG: AbrB/MazE/SpoVT family DNA-binding domain-containing protein [Gaiellales bacterium]|jgi:antitoxin PrlF